MPYKDPEKKKENKRKWYRENKEKWVDYQEANKEKIAKYQKEYRKKNKERILKQQKEYRYKNREVRLHDQKEYYQLHKDEKKEYDKKYNQLNKDKIKKQKRRYRRKQYRENLNCRLLCVMSTRIRRALNGTVKKSEKTIVMVGCSIENLKQHLEEQFKEGMSWDNYGEWQIDHIRPCASFDLSKSSEQHQCFNYLNLQPLWRSENANKGAKIL